MNLEKKIILCIQIYKYYFLAWRKLSTITVSCFSFIFYYYFLSFICLSILNLLIFIVFNYALYYILVFWIFLLKLFIILQLAYVLLFWVMLLCDWLMISTFQQFILSYLLFLHFFDSLYMFSIDPAIVLTIVLCAW